jgi:hypothetical protein
MGLVAWKLARFAAIAIAILLFLSWIEVLPSPRDRPFTVVASGAPAAAGPMMADTIVIAEADLGLAEMLSLTGGGGGNWLMADLSRTTLVAFFRGLPGATRAPAGRLVPKVDRIDRTGNEARVIVSWRESKGDFGEDVLYRPYIVISIAKQPQVESWVAVNSGDGTELARARRFQGRWVAAQIPILNRTTNEGAIGRTVAAGRWGNGGGQANRIILGYGREQLNELSNLLPEPERKLLGGIDLNSEVLLACFQGSSGWAAGERVLVDFVEVVLDSAVGRPLLSIGLRWQNPAIVRGIESFHGPWEPSYHILAVPRSSLLGLTEFEIAAPGDFLQPNQVSGQ